MGNNKKSSLRSQARFHAVQAIYSWQISHNDATEVFINLLPEIQAADVEMDYLRQLFFSTIEAKSAIDTAISPYVNRVLSDIDPVELAILRLGAYELMYCLSVPYRVAINESVELAKTFGATDGHKFVNGVLDKLAQEVRAIEIAAKLGK